MSPIDLITKIKEGPMFLKGKNSPITVTRQNHALEHATIALMLQKLGINTRIAGRATHGSFYLYGSFPTQLVTEAAHQALARLQRGEAGLAVSPFCGTNLAVAGVLAGIASLVAVGGKNRVLNLPRVLIAALGAVIAAQPLGRLVQKRLTTEADLDNLQIQRITKHGFGGASYHKVETSISP